MKRSSSFQRTSVPSDKTHFTKPAILSFSLLFLLTLLSASRASAQLDQYGGDTADPCSGGATGYFYTAKDAVSQHWWFCDPAGNRFFMLGVEVVDYADASGYAKVMTSKYGDTGYDGFSGLLNRLQTYGFNTVGDDSNWYALPVKTNAGAGNSVKLPFIWQIHPSYGFSNSLYPFKDVISTLSAAYTGYRADPLGDFFDPNWTSYANYGPTGTSGKSPWGASPPFSSFSALDASPWLLGVSLDDGGSTWGFMNATPPASGVGPHPGWMVAATTPNQVYAGRWKIVYPDTVMHSKQEWANWLQQTADSGPGYTSITALNDAWGANYSTFGSSGISVTGEVIGTGNGKTKSFTHTLKHKVVDPWSVAVLEGASTHTGDCPWFDYDCGNKITANTGLIGAIGGVSGGTIDYRAGTLTVTFSTAPASGTAITVNYIYGGWPHGMTGGTGLLDEDGTNPWFPSDFHLPDLLNSNPPRVDLDLDNFAGHLAHQYFSTLQAAVKAKLPHHLVFSQNFLGAYDRPVILQQAGQYLDALIFEDVDDSAQLVTAYGIANKPAFLEERFIANPDSAFAAYACDSTDNPAFACQTTQQARGQAYTAQLALDLGLRGTDGFGFLIGWDYWEMTDKSSERQNFGLWSALDNAYNGAEDLSGSQPCAPEVTLPGYVCGLELQNHGDYLSAVAAANASWYAP
ncbi:MAG TPA: hypothetical protein VGW33_15215 [Terriglobia bacterium]|nr:hypothetical protein [Terriglobia bacterium]